jgi:hypothetical protein
MLYHNNGDGTFTNVTFRREYFAGRQESFRGRCDYDNDGWPDLFVANDG